MLLIFLFLCVITVRGFTFQEALDIAECLRQCQNVSCRNYCSQPTDGFEPYPTLNEEAGANVSLHCKEIGVLMIRHNPGIYVIEQSVNNNTWGATIVSNGELSTFSNLTANKLYRYRLHRITQLGVSSAEISDWFATYTVNHQPREIEYISLQSIEVEKENACALQAEVTFQPAKDRSCNYYVLFWSEEHNLFHFPLRKVRNFVPVRNNILYNPRQNKKSFESQDDVKMVSDFRFSLKHLQYDRNVTLLIRSSNHDFSRTSNATTFAFHTPSCLEVHNNLSVCAPEMVKGLQARRVRNREDSYDILISWDKPVLQPDNYTLQIDLLNYEPHVLTVPGDAVETFLRDVDVSTLYEISIVAESTGGVSLPSTLLEGVDAKEKVVELSYREIVMVIPTLMIIAIVLGVICMRRRNEKDKQADMEYMHFEDPAYFLKKPLKPDYAIESDTLLSHDKFEITPQQLKLKNILGSGAYGIVRLASLQDEFGTNMDVAVKMMKDDPRMEDVENFHHEISMMKSAGQHPNIVSLIGYCTLYHKPLLVVEYCSKGDLQTYLRTIWQNLVNAVFERKMHLKFGVESVTDKEENGLCNNTLTITNRLYDIQQDVMKHTENITSADLLSFARQVATGMEFLSSNRIVHRDLAARNVLVRPDRVVKISDFGLSRDIYQENVYRKKGNGKLPLKWMAIEALTHQIYTTYSDVWAFGILLWEIVTLGAMPYPSTPPNRILQLLKSGYRMERPPNCSWELYNVMYSCWNLRPQSRPTFTELKQSLDNLLSNYSENKYLNLYEILQESVDESSKSRSIDAC